MQKFGVYIRSKMPILSGNNQLNEEAILLPTRNISASNITSVSNDMATSYQSQQVDALDENFRLEKDVSGNDFHIMNDKSSQNLIDEWQAAWNVTNAIQVILFLLVRIILRE